MWRGADHAVRQPAKNRMSGGWCSPRATCDLHWCATTARPRCAAVRIHRPIEAKEGQRPRFSARCGRLAASPARFVPCKCGLHTQRPNREHPSERPSNTRLNGYPFRRVLDGRSDGCSRLGLCVCNPHLHGTNRAGEAASRPHRAEKRGLWPSLASIGRWIRTAAQRGRAVVAHQCKSQVARGLHQPPDIRFLAGWRTA